MISLGNLYIVKDKSMFNLTRQFALLSFFCILVIGTVSTIMVSKLINEKILLRDATLSMEFVESVIASEGTWNMFLDTPELTGQEQSTASHWALESFFSHVGHMPDVVRANVYGRDHSVLWSSNSELLGEHFNENEELNEALRGELVFNSGIIGLFDKEEHILFDKKFQGMRFIETYMPVWNKDHSQVVGAVELYRIPIMLHQSIVEARHFIWLGAMTGGLLLFLCLYWIIKRASLVMESQQQRLIEAKSLLVIGQTASAITHAMRNPLSSIRACAELSLTDDLEGVRESARDIIGETDRLDRWARDFLQFSVANKDTPERLDMNNLIKAVIKEHEPTLKRSEIALHFKACEEKLPVEANFTPLSQVFGNLIMNAIEAMGDGGELTIRTFLDRNRSKVCVSIEDNGPGLSDEIKDRLFQPFATTKATGTGLGLALSRHLVDHYHGFLEIVSNSGRGVTVSVCLPLSGESL